jgi:hypothetical protein
MRVTAIVRTRVLVSVGSRWDKIGTYPVKQVLREDGMKRNKRSMCCTSRVCDDPDSLLSNSYLRTNKAGGKAAGRDACEEPGSGINRFAILESNQRSYDRGKSTNDSSYDG